MRSIDKSVQRHPRIAVPLTQSVQHPIEPDTSRCCRIVGVALKFAAFEEMRKGNSVGGLAQHILRLHHDAPSTCASAMKEPDLPVHFDMSMPTALPHRCQPWAQRLATWPMQKGAGTRKRVETDGCAGLVSAADLGRDVCSPRRHASRRLQ